MPLRIIDMMPMRRAVMMMLRAVIMVMMMNMRFRASAMAMISRTHGDALVLARVNGLRDKNECPGREST
jgi:hypothetical protein